MRGVLGAASMTPSQRPWRGQTNVRRRRLRMDCTTTRSIYFTAETKDRRWSCRRALPCRRCLVSLSESPCHKPSISSPQTSTSCLIGKLHFWLAPSFILRCIPAITSPASPLVFPQISFDCRVPDTTTRQGPLGCLRLDLISSLLLAVL